MGVNSLWEILSPTARPVRLELLSRKKLAVDASIWIYQFMKAVRDREGNALPLSHIVGFFRRICKLLFFGILPVFVFDGGAPPLKRETITKRRERRQGRRQDSATTAQKLLAIQVQREAEERGRRPQKVLEGSRDVSDQETLFLEDLPNQHPSHTSGAPKSASPERRFVRKDEYHLPDIQNFDIARGDARVMPEGEFNEYATKADAFNTVDGIDIDSVDPKLKEFELLPMPTQYMILSHLRLRSRLRMGYSKDQLVDLFPNSMDFSRFQIQQVKKRNFYTQRLMDVSGMGGDGGGNVTKRIAGDKDRKYALVKNADGWTLSLGGDSSETNPIHLDETGDVVEEEEAKAGPSRVKNEPLDIKNDTIEVKSDDSESDIEWEDVPIEKEETQEEMNVQRAIIESIYDLYNGKSGTEEGVMKRAIEDSKRDLVELQEREKQALPEKEVSQNNLNFAFSLSLLFGANLSALKQPEKENKENVDLEEEEAGPNDDQNPSFSTKVSITEHPTPEVNMTKTEKRSPFEAIDLGDSSEEEKAEALEEPEVGEVAPAKPMPEWFNNTASQIENVHHPPQESNKKPEKFREDEEAGIIPWNDAKEYINRDFEEVEESEDDDIEEIGAPEVEKGLEKEHKEVPQVVGDLNNVINETEKAQPRKAAVLDYDFEEIDENELIANMRVEEMEHENFRTQIKKDSQIPVNTTQVSNEQLLQEQLLKARREADEVTETMINDVQELLKRFGIPYITAPMEAEAQCAELMKLGLVDGIVTDDGDCFLFGGDRVYKNMFNQKQYVECYIMSEIEAKIGLDQEKMIELGLLLGSDYTEGVKGVGPVMAMEILAEFGSLENLKKWFDENTKTVPKNTELTALKKTLLNRVKSGKLFLPDTFPDSVVFDAYKMPLVDHDRSQFKWGVPNLDQIRLYLMYNVGWQQLRVDEVMVPLIRDMNRKKAEGSQSTIGEFFPQEYISARKELGLGKRMKSAASKLTKTKRPRKDDEGGMDV